MSTATIPGSTRRRRPLAVVGAIGAALCGLIFLAPLLWALASSLRPNDEVLRYLNPISLHTVFSTHPTLANYWNLLRTPLGAATVNSLVVSAATVVIGLPVCALAAFALAAIPFPGRNAVFGIVVLSFLIPFDAIAIPLADLFRGAALQNTFLGLILPGLGNGLAIFLLRQFFLSVPTELVEAGRLDGLGWWGLFRQLYMPLSIPPLIGASLTLFLFQWQSYVWPLLIGTDATHTLGPIALANFQGQYSVDYGLLFAGAIVLTAIPLIIILGFQRYFIQSASTSGLKD